MLLGSPEVTPYDLRFRLLRIPVRVHPLFWLIMLLISGDLDNRNPTGAAVFVACAFLSILVHEMGHGLSSRLMGEEPIGITLYAMGGFCAFHQMRLSPWRRLLVLFSGPGAGFLLLGAVFAYGVYVGVPESPALSEAYWSLIRINLVWGVLNLFPLWPLDGGQMLGVVLGMFSARNGMRWAHVVSLLVAGGLAVCLFSFHEYMMALWFGYFGFINYQVLQTLHYAYHSADDGEWWRQ
jgi:stage IV sporulation protein FB